MNTTEKDKIDSVLKKYFNLEAIIDVDCGDDEHCKQFKDCRECTINELLNTYEKLEGK
jgi:hypothetical protein